MTMRSAPWSCAAAVLAGLLAAGPAEACSCVAVRESDAAVVPEVAVVELMPPQRLSAGQSEMGRRGRIEVLRIVKGRYSAAAPMYAHFGSWCELEAQVGDRFRVRLTNNSPSQVDISTCNSTRISAPTSGR